jgi:hypothetical protein
MITETYEGRKLTARRGREWGTTAVAVNGQTVASALSTDLRGALAGVRETISLIDREPFINGDRWAAHWYAPGTYEMCPRELHPMDIGGQCRHSTCVRERA